MNEKKKLVLVLSVAGVLVVALAALAVISNIARRDAHARLVAFEAQRDDVCTSVKVRLYVIAKAPGDSRLQNLHAYAPQVFANESVNRMCIKQSVDLSDAEACWIKRGDETCFVESLSSLYDAYERQPWRAQ